MSRYPLQTVLDLRQRQEEAAGQRLADAMLQLTRARARESERKLRVEGARQRLADATRVGQPPGRDDGTRNTTASALLDEAKFVHRLRSDLEHAREALDQYRSGELARAIADEKTARDDHLAARRARESFTKHAEKHLAVTRTIVARQQEELLDDITRANRYGRAAKGEP